MTIYANQIKNKIWTIFISSISKMIDIGFPTKNFNFCILFMLLCLLILQSIMSLILINQEKLGKGVWENLQEVIWCSSGYLRFTLSRSGVVLNAEILLGQLYQISYKFILRVSSTSMMAAWLPHLL